MVCVGLMVGCNRGGEDVEQLRYAHRDAEKVRDVFVELGGMLPERGRLLLEIDAAELERAMEQCEQTVRRAKVAGQRVLLVLYYSGHAKDGALHLGDTSMDMGRVRSWLESSAADIRLAFIDACQSGELTRLKGGTLAPSIVDLQEDTSGHIILSSSSARESSQESDEIGGSFFTHYLVSGLRGTADRSGDGAVSIREIYEFTYNRTVNRTASTRGGTQHPTYGYRLSGRGEILLTRTAEAGSRFVFSEPLAGTYLIYDLDKHRIAAELLKTEGQRRCVAVAPGSYVVKKRRDADLLIGRFDLQAGQRWVIRDAELRPVAFEDDSTKGLVAIREKDWQIGYSFRFGAEAFFDAPTREDLFYTSLQGGFQVEFLGLLYRGLSLALDLMLAAGQDETVLEIEGGGSEQVPTDFFRFQLGVAVHYHLDWDWFGVYGGPRLTFLMASRSFGGVFENRPAQTFGTLSPGLTIGAVFHLGSFDIFAEGRIHYLYYNIDGDSSLGFGGGYLGVAYRH